MTLAQDAQLLRIFIGEQDKYDGKPLYEALVMEARKIGLAGATVYRGILGYGANSVVHTDKILRLSQGMPMVVEIVDTPAKIESFLPTLDEMMDEGLATLEKARVIIYRHNEG
jgi:PII-like signaling protein